MSLAAAEGPFPATSVVGHARFAQAIGEARQILPAADGEQIGDPLNMQLRYEMQQAGKRIAGR
jgi:hypothetical protein